MTYAVRYIKRVLCAIITIAFLPLFAFSQSVNISGKIYDAATGKPVESAMVMLQNRDGRTMYGDAITQADGCYSISFNSKADTRIYAHPVDAMRESTGQNYLVIITGGRAELVTPSDPVSLWYDPLELE